MARDVVEYFRAEIERRHQWANGSGYLWPVSLPFADAEALLAVVEAAWKAAEENDYCFVCDCHPSHGHEKCALARLYAGSSGEKPHG